MASKDSSDVSSPVITPGSFAPTFPIVGIGASAGGLAAFKTFLRHTPSDTGMAFVLVQHVDPFVGGAARGTELASKASTNGMTIEVHISGSFS